MIATVAYCWNASIVVPRTSKIIKKRKVPGMTMDQEAEAFLEPDLSGLDFSQFKPVRFEFETKAAQHPASRPAA